MHLLDIASLTREQVESVFELTDRIKADPTEYDKSLEGKCCILFFPETSIRTRITFEKAISSMGGKSIHFPPATLDKKERLVDVMGYMENWADMVIVRHPRQEVVSGLAKQAAVPVINAMTSIVHPCEILSDLYSYREMDANYDHMTFTFVGEHANILQSWVEAAEVMDLKLNHVFFEGNRVKHDNANYCFTTDLETVIATTDHLMTDPVPSDLRTADYMTRYRITLEMIERAIKAGKHHITVNPCPPFNVGSEVTQEVIDSPYFVGYGFKKNLLYVQQAIILKCLEGHL